MTKVLSEIWTRNDNCGACGFSRACTHHLMYCNGTLYYHVFPIDDHELSGCSDGFGREVLEAHSLAEARAKLRSRKTELKRELADLEKLIAAASKRTTKFALYEEMHFTDDEEDEEDEEDEDND